MGVDFYLLRVKRKSVRKSTVHLPDIQAQFAFTEYPRFLAALAEAAGLGELWTRYRKDGAALVERIIRRALETHASSSGARPAKGRKQRQVEPKSAMPADDTDLDALERAVEQAQAEIENLSDREPFVEFLLSRTDDAKLSSAACGRIAPRIRAVAERWEPAPKGCVGWHEHALEIADAMELAGKYPDLAFVIAG